LKTVVLLYIGILKGTAFIWNRNYL